MGQPAARAGDMHACPMVTPGTPPVPHVGGPVLPPGCPTVLIGSMPAARATDMCTCVGPPDSIVKGSTGVLIGNMPAARMGDTTAHGGTIAVGFPTVLIGEVGAGSPVVLAASGGGGASMAAGAGGPGPQAQGPLGAQAGAGKGKGGVVAPAGPAAPGVPPGGPKSGFVIRGTPQAGSGGGDDIAMGPKRPKTPLPPDQLAAMMAECRRRMTQISGDPNWPKAEYMQAMLEHGASVEDVVRQFSTYLGMFGGDVHAQVSYDHDRGQEPAFAWMFNRPMIPPRN